MGATDLHHRLDSPPARFTGRDLAALLFALGFPSLLTWLYFVALADQPSGLQQGVYTLGKCIQFGFPAAWVFLVGWTSGATDAATAVRPVDRRRFWLGIGEGLLFGAFIFALVVLAYRYWLGPAELLAAAIEPIRAKVSGFGVDSPARFIALGAFYSIAHSWLEEYYWRWFVFGGLRRGLAVGPAIAVSSLGFMAHHVIVLATYFGWASWPTWGFSAAVAIGGAAWAWVYHRSGSLWGAWLSHLLVDVAIFVVGYRIVFG